MSTEDSFAGWAVLELMGHRKLAGFVQEQEIAGAGFLRIDIPGRDGTIAATQFYPPNALYCLTPTTEEIARAMAPRHQPAPVTPWELQLPEATVRPAGPPDVLDEPYYDPELHHDDDDIDDLPL